MKLRIAFFALMMLLAVSPAWGQTASVSQDKGPINVRLTFYVIQADGFTNDDSEIRPIVVELRKLFKFQGYRLASKSILQASARGQAVPVKQTVTGLEGEVYVISASVAMAGDGEDRSRASLKVSLNSDAGDLVDASVTLRDGKTVLLGSAMGGKNKAIILAVTPTIE
jgi:hypothetical protein